MTKLIFPFLDFSDVLLIFNIILKVKTDKHSFSKDVKKTEEPVFIFSQFDTGMEPALL